MFAEVKAMLPVSGDGYDAEIILQIRAAALDLARTSEIVLPGVISITRAQDPRTGAWTVTDSSTVEDPLVVTAIATWCNMRIGNPPNYDQLLAAYESMKGSMRLSEFYNRQSDGEEDR